VSGLSAVKTSEASFCGSLSNPEIKKSTKPACQHDAFGVAATALIFIPRRFTRSFIDAAKSD